MMTPAENPLVQEAQPIEIIESPHPFEMADQAAAPAEPVAPAKDEEIEVVVGPSKTPEPVPVDPKRPDYAEVEDQVQDPKIKRRFAALTWARENERRRAEQATAQRDEAIRVAQMLANRAASQATENHTVARYAVNIGQEKVKNDLAAAHQELIEAQANGDSKRIADATVKMTRAQAESMQVENVNLPEAPIPPQEILEFQQLQQRLQQEQALAQQQAAQPQADPEVIENFRSWAAKNPWYQPAQVDPRTGTILPRSKESLYAEQVSSILELEGKAFGTAEHFAELESRLPWKRQGAQQSTVPQQTQAVQQTPPRQSSPAVAPVGVSRSSAGRKVYTLTPEQAHIARAFGMSNEEYAKEFYANA